jgi:sucrose-6-phosphate hydrolase SacC (GH32 family)
MLTPRHLVATLVLTLSAALPGHAQAPDYTQPFRPQIHFSPAKNWTNDPNGLVYFRGEYHLFFQYNPFGAQWGHMSWGHAVSRDLLHWHELPVALPEADGISIFTGSVVVDRANTSGFCTPSPEGCLVAVYTGADLKANRQFQNIAYSNDAGRTWTKFAGNPVLDLHLADFRDPSVQWDELGKHWLMAVSLPKEHIVRFYTSPDLKQWTKLSDFGPAGDVGGDWECPDLLKVPAANGKSSLWALKVGLNPGAPQGGSGEQYFLGSFDGTHFTQSQKTGSHGYTNYGKDDYCAISFNDQPRGDQPVLIGWMSNWQYADKLPTSPWRGQMSVPRRLSFVEDSAGLALRQVPVLPATVIERTLIAPLSIHQQYPAGTRGIVGIRIYSDSTHWTEVGFDLPKSLFYIDREHSGLTLSADFTPRTTAPIVPGRGLDFTVIVDRSSVEAFAQRGTIAMTDLIFPAGASLRIEPFPAKAASTPTIRSFGSIW